MRDQHLLAALLRDWRARWGLSEEHASELLSTMPYNVGRAEDGTLLPARAGALMERLLHVSRTMDRCRCVVRRARLRQPVQGAHAA